MGDDQIFCPAFLDSVVLHPGSALTPWGEVPTIDYIQISNWLVWMISSLMHLIIDENR